MSWSALHSVTCLRAVEKYKAFEWKGWNKCITLRLYQKIIYNSNSTTPWITLRVPSVGFEDNLFCNVWRSHVASGREEVFTIKIRYSNWQTSRGMVVFMSFSDAFNAIITSIRVCLISSISRFYVRSQICNKQKHSSVANRIWILRRKKTIVPVTYIFLEKLSKHDE